ncbi:hypothetical protein [Streptomyces klenkii]|uniref:hypothetical protein n=1 Tax=Streptomyces klenkii TaxID=1420899 RepID=UPI0034471B50
MITSMARPTHTDDRGTAAVLPLPRPALGQPVVPGARGEGDPQAQLHALVKHLVVDGDIRAGRAGRKAARTLADMALRLADGTTGAVLR